MIGDLSTWIIVLVISMSSDPVRSIVLQSSFVISIRVVGGTLFVIKTVEGLTIFGGGDGLMTLGGGIF